MSDLFRLLGRMSACNIITSCLIRSSSHFNIRKPLTLQPAVTTKLKLHSTLMTLRLICRFVARSLRRIQPEKRVGCRSSRSRLLVSGYLILSALSISSATAISVSISLSQLNHIAIGVSSVQHAAKGARAIGPVVQEWQQYGFED